MERRGFLGLLGAVVAAPLVPAPAPSYIGMDLASASDRTVYIQIAFSQAEIDAIARGVSDAMLRDLRRRTMFPPR